MLMTRSREDEGTRFAFGGEASEGEVEAVRASWKRSSPRSCNVGTTDSCGASRAAKVARENRERTVKRVHVIQLGGRSRLDASRVFSTGSPQGLVEHEGASQEEARSTAWRRARVDRRRNGARLRV